MPTTQWDQPLTFKTLTILALLYRAWAAARLEDLGPWVQSWATPDMFAIMEGTDAAMGAYRSASAPLYEGCPSQGAVTTFGRPTT